MTGAIEEDDVTTTVFRRVAPAEVDRRRMRRSPDRLTVYAVLTVTVFLAYILARETSGTASMVLAAIGVSACGWSWLLARVLFDPEKQDALWPRLVVLVLAVSGATAVLAPAGGPIVGAADNLYVLSGSAALLLTVIEPFQTHGCALTRAETGFRILFGGVFSLLVAAAVLAAWTAPERVETVCAVIGLAGAVAAVFYRRAHPLTREERAPAPRPPATIEERQTAERLERLLRDQAVHLDPDLRIADVAARLGEPEHRVSRCVSAATGFPNFNRLINHHRVEAAKRRLAAADEAGSILQIALDCGFASLGPFNRAFREETGMTPRAYRAAQRSGAPKG